MGVIAQKPDAIAVRNGMRPAASAPAWRERSLDGHPLLACINMSLQSHRGTEARQETSGPFH